VATVIDPASHTGSQYIGKSALCQLLGWSRPRLDLRLETDPRFPVAQRGVRGGGWRFDASAVLAYLRGDGNGARGPAGGEGFEHLTEPAPASTSKSRAIVMHSGEQSARQRRDAVQAEILEDKLRRDRGELVEATAMRQVLAIMQAGINKGFDRLCEQIVGLPGMSGADPVVRELVDELRSMMTAELRSLLERR